VRRDAAAVGRCPGRDGYGHRAPRPLV
jgi:hypothetical protein